MGRRGPAPTPTAILQLRGSLKAASRVGEPHIDPQSPPCPSWVNPSARKYWSEITAMLDGIKVMAMPHSVALALLVDSLAGWIELSKKCETANHLVRGSTGNKVANPLFAMKDRAWDRLMKACVQFGMTPSAITSVRAVDETKKQPEGIAALRLAE